MTRTLKTVQQFAAETAFTESQIRWWIFNENNNGLHDAGAIVRIGRRVYIDVNGFDRWVNAQNAQSVAA